MRVLLDTHAFLWWITDSPRLSGYAREVISGSNELLFSAASGWEIAIKARLGKLQVPEDLGKFITGQLSRNEIEVLPVYLGHALHVHTLPSHHHDPFDRLLISQASLEGLPVLSADSQLSRYPVEVLW